MRTLYFDCAMGAAGDMLTAALLELHPDPDSFLKKLNDLGIPHVEFIPEKSLKCGIEGTHMSVKVHGHEEGDSDYDHEHSHEHDHDHDHEHSHDHVHDHSHEHTHHHDHHHSSMHDISHIVSHMNIPEKVAKDVCAVYELIAEAESNAHGVPVEQIHFHEVGNLDAIADVTAVCLLISEINPDNIVVSPIHVGAGTVRCAHGILPVPAPATAYILREVPIYGGSIQSELCTPTGAALLKHFANKFGPMPQMAVEKIGYGMGRKDFPVANCVRAMVGESTDKLVVSLSCNLDDMTGEEIGFAVDEISKKDIVDVFTTPILMKKSRPATMLTVICVPEKADEIAEAIFRNTTTLGIRKSEDVLLTKDGSNAT